MATVVTTNNVPRELINGFQLPIEARSDFDYLNWEAIEKGEDNAYFFRYRGSWYSLDQFTATPSKSEVPAYKGWSGFLGDSFFSGILVRLIDHDNESIVVGSWYSNDD